MCSDECIRCEHYDIEDDYCYFQDMSADEAREWDDLDGFEPIDSIDAEIYINDLAEAEAEINTRNTSGTSLDRLKSKFPDKNFI